MLKVCNARFSYSSNQIIFKTNVEISPLLDQYNMYPSTFELQILLAKTDEFVEFLNE